MQSYEIRKSFLNFFSKENHNIVASSALVPQGDPSLLFTSAGMVQFKPYYLGLKTDMTKAASCQKCFRTTDIDNVGNTIRHLTFFEMLGNFSFGDYFKEESLLWGYKFLTKDMGIDSARLYFSVYKGGVAPKDEEAIAIWKKILPANLHSHIFEMGEDNFWAMGDTGPSGPCSEIYYDRGEAFSHKDCSGPGCSCDRYIEIWNHVFTQFDRQSDGSFKPLPKKNIDTGMGLERLAFIVEGKNSPFETSLFYPITDALLKKNKTLKYDINSNDIKSFRIIADHLRGASFLISEGVLPSNEGRGYVLRRLIRRAQRFGMVMGIKDPFLYDMVDSVISIFKDTYPQIEKNKEHISSALKYEEIGFLETLEKGEKYLADIMAKSGKMILGKDAFYLYETYGFPLELTREIALKNGIGVDEDGFQVSKKQAQNTAKSAWKSSGEKDAFIFQKAEEKFKNTEFLGYDSFEVSSKLSGIINDKGDFLDNASSKEFWLVFEKTPFYAESGGQLADSGLVFLNKEKVAEIFDVQRPIGDVVYHKAKILKEIKAGLSYELKLDKIKRLKTAANHTAIHLVNAALKKVFGETLRQAGSWVNEEKFRFDYTLAKTPLSEELKQVEDLANEAIKKGYKVFKEVRPLSDCEKLNAVILVGEKYSDPARFVLINEKGFKQADERYSLELCGGTHVNELKDVFFVKIVKDSSVSRGIRRIEGVAGYAAIEYMSNFFDIAENAALILGSQPEEIAQRINKLKEENKILKDDLHKAKTSKTSQPSAEKKELSGGVFFVSQEAQDFDMKILRELSDRYRNENKNSIIFVYAQKEGKLNFIVALSKDVTDSKFDAQYYAGKISEKIGGRAGGRRDFAQGGGTVPENMKKFIDEIFIG